MSDFKQIYVTDRQSLVDIAMQEYGCYDGLFLLLQDNEDRLTDLSDVPAAGMKLNIQTPVPMITGTNQLVAAFYQSKSVKVVSNATPPTPPPTTVPYVTPGYWHGGYVRPGLRIQNLSVIANLVLHF